MNISEFTNRNQITLSTQIIRNSFQHRLQTVPLKALVVDDHQDLRFMFSHLLEDYGFDVTTAEDGEEALNILLEYKKSYSLLLTDFNMPKLNGKELIEKSIEKGVLIEKIIVLSGMMGNENQILELIHRNPHIRFFNKLSQMPELKLAILS